MEPEELLDRVTVLRDLMEPSALEIMEAELAGRGVGPDDIHQHHRQMKHRIIRDARGLPAQCSWCARAAVEQRTGLHKLFKLIPLGKRTYFFCEKHFGEKGSEYPR
jgi:hypothetical protein